nr:MAG TPA_asm: hypothetical protein [Caudoviricetes sp.]
MQPDRNEREAHGCGSLTLALSPERAVDAHCLSRT